MEHTAPAILELGLLLVLATLAGKAARQVGLPAVLGYLAVGLIVSPFTPGYVANREQLAVLADIGVVLLLFEVGIEINPIHLARQRRLLLLAPAQVFITWAVAAVVVGLFGVSTAGAAMVGLSIAMSSSVVVVNITRSARRTTDAGTDAALLSWSVVQDLLGVTSALVLMVVIGLQGRSGLAALGGMLAFIALAAAAAVVLPWMLRRLRADHDLFLLLSIGSGLLLAGLGSRFLGIPLALAAFVAGLAITESEEAGEARLRLLPFRDVFAVMFFVSLGTVIDPSALGAALPWLALVVGLVIATKVAPAWALARFGKLEARPLQLAVGLGQVGEFSYVLGALALTAGIITNQLETALVAAVVITIAASSVLVRLIPKVSKPA
ncbi:MAG TPA: cation:proton antiporter [Candidatus Dormibacteraeota bacterium]|nr:cation:proton antiporter [Candidatus Dormibacteraeota bacterium]